RRVPLRNHGGPFQRQAVPGETVVDVGPGVKSDVAHRQYLKAKPRRRNPVKIAGLGKELKDLVKRPFKPLLAMKHADAHCAGFASVSRLPTIVALVNLNGSPECPGYCGRAPSKAT